MNVSHMFLWPCFFFKSKFLWPRDLTNWFSIPRVDAPPLLTQHYPPPPPTCYESLPNPRLDSDRPPQLKKVPPSFPFFFFSYFFINIFQFYPSLSFPFSEILLGFAGPLGPESARILFRSTYGFRFVSVTSTLYGSHPTWTSMLEEKNQREIYFLSK